MKNFLSNLLKAVPDEKPIQETAETYFPLDVTGTQKKVIPAEQSAELTMKDKAIQAIKTVYDPEIPIDIYELGLIYDVKVNENNDIAVLMTLTSPGCFAAGQIPGEVEKAVATVEGVNKVYVELTFDPPWDKTMMSEAAQLELGFW